MGLYSILARCLALRKNRELSTSERLQAAPFAFRQLERRRVLDASAAAALLTPLGDMSDTVQAGDNIPSEPSAEETEVAQNTEAMNTAPSGLQLFLPSQVTEGDAVQIGLVFSDVDEVDTHTLEIDWGDGSPIDSITLNSGEVLGPHTYLDDNPTGTPSDMNEVLVTITDSYGESVTATTMIEVLNVDPQITFMNVVQDAVDENGNVTLQLAFEDVGTEDTHTVTIDWGDGLGIETLELTSGERALTTTHTYLDDDPTATSSDVYTISVTVTDDDTGTSDTATDTVTVNNVAPSITFLNVTPETIDENQAVNLQLAFDDPGGEDTHTVTIDWGDGSALETIELTSGERAIATSHTYLDDDPTATSSDVYTISVTVTDDDTGTSDTATDTVTVNNVAPSITFLNVTPETIDENQAVNLQLAFDDPGGEDTHTVTIDWGDGSALETIELTSGERAIATSHTYLDDDPTATSSDVYTISVTVTDDDTGTSDTATDTVTVNNVAPSITFLNVTPETIDENQAVNLQLAFDDPGGEDTHTVTIDWGDGSALETIELTSGERAIATSHTYLDDDPTATSSDVYTISVTVTDDDTGTSDTATDTVTVNNVAPSITFLNVTPETIDENQAVNLQLAFDDPGGEDTHTVTIDWGDGSALETIELTSGERAIATSHTYLDDDPTATSSDVYTISVTVTDDDTGTSDTATDTVTVNNVAPSITFLNVTPETIDENQAVNLQLAFDDPGGEDTHTVTIDWGDGSALETIELTSGERAIATSHTYLDDDPTATSSDVYTISVTVTDDDTGTSDTATDTVTVNNVAPSITFLNVTPETIDENQAVNLQLAFDDPGGEDTHTVTIDWGDGSALETIELTSGERAIATSHTYLDDDPTATSSDVYTISVTVTDDDTGTSDTATDTVTVNNVAPSITFLNVTPETIDENQAVNLQLAFDDPGGEDTHTVTIDWGDGSALETIELTSGERAIATSHTYLDDDPTATSSDVYTISVTVTDDDTGTSDTATDTVTVNNVAPSITFLNVTPETIDENQAVNLQLAFDDPGGEDTHTVTIDWGDGSALETIELTSGERAIATSHTYLDDDPTATSSDVYTISVTVTDDDTGTSDTATDTVTVNNVAPSITFLNVTPETIDENQAVNLQLAFDDPGGEDTHTVTIDWGDGSALETIELTSGERAIATSHTYLDDDPTATSSDVYTISVTVTDDDTGTSDTATDTVTVNNVAPVVTINGEPVSSPEGTQIDLTSTVVDPGTLDTFTYEWEVTVNGNVVATGSDPNFSFTPADNGTYVVSLKVTDDDTLMGTDSVSIEITNVAPPLDPIDDVTAAEGEFITFPSVTFSDPGFDLEAADTEENFTATIDWGDGTTEPPLDITVTEIPGSEGVLTTGTISATHAYADNGEYTVTVTVIDDDELSTSRTFNVMVSNVAPTLTGYDGTPFVLNEGEIFSLADFDVGLSDPGFTLAAAGTMETFTLDSVDWGDGSDLVLANLSVFNVDNGAEGASTTASFESAEHAYADNDTYTVTLTFSDDDEGTTVATFEVMVNNVAPTLQLTQGMFIINEGDTLVLTDQDALNPDDILGTFSDPGFDNPALDTQESFSYTVTWGDDTGVMNGTPSETISGSQGVLTVGTLLDMHEYIDNDIDGVFTVTVTLTDDDGGSHTQSFTVQVNNVAPTLDPLIATDVDTSGQTVLTLTFTDPGQEQDFVEFGDDPFTVMVDWGYMRGDPDLDGFQEEFVYAGDTPGTFVVTHTYRSNGSVRLPNPANPAADITLRVMILDDDTGNPLIVDNSPSNIEIVVISNPGIGDQPIVVDTTAEVPRLAFVRENTTVLDSQVTATSELSVGGGDARAASTDAKATTEQILELRVIDPYGVESEGIRLKAQVLNNLPKLFVELPDNHYVIYLIRQETNTERLVIEVYLREGEIIDPGDDSDSLRKRPPNEETIDDKQQQPAEGQTSEDASAMLQEIRNNLNDDFLHEREIRVAPIDQTSSRGSANTHLAVTATGLVAARSFGVWARRVDQTLAQANKKKWRQLRQRNRSERKKR